MTHVIVFGDSVAYGLFDKSGGWLQRIRAKVDARNITLNGYWTLVYNLSVSGATSSDILARIETELPARKESDEPKENIVLFAVGVNDSIYLLQENRPRISEDEFQRNIQALTRIARKQADRVGFVGLFLVDQPSVDPIPWAPGMAYRNALIRKLDGALRKACEAEGVSYIDLLSLWNENEAKRYLQDGVHPNNDGHRLIAERISDFFRKYELIE